MPTEPTVEPKSNTANMETISVFLVGLFAFFFVRLLLGNSSSRKQPPHLLSLSFVRVLWRLTQGYSLHFSLSDYISRRGPISQLNFFGWKIVIVSGRQLVQDALLKQGVTFASRPDFYLFRQFKVNETVAFRPWGDVYRAHRRLLTSSLHMLQREREENYLETLITERTDALVTGLVNHPGTPVAPHNLVSNTVSDVISSVLFGAESAEDKDAKINALFNKQAKGELQETRFSTICVLVAREFLPVRVQRWVGISYEQKAQEWENSGELFEEITEDQATSHQEGEMRCLTDALLMTFRVEKKKLMSLGLTKTVVQNAGKELIEPATRTVKGTLVWALLYMACHPDIQAKVQQELDDVIGRENAPRACDRNRTPYTEATILEVWRHLSFPSFLLPHATTQDTDLGGYFLPRGTTVFFSSWSTAKSREIWRDPDTFDPCHFLTPDGSALDLAKAQSIMPFGLGKRRCLGEYLGRMQAYLVFARVLQRCSISLAPGENYNLQQLLTIKGYPPKYRVIVTPREEDKHTC